MLEFRHRDTLPRILLQFSSCCCCSFRCLPTSFSEIGSIGLSVDQFSRVLAPASSTCCVLQLQAMALIPRLFDRSVFDSSLASSIFDPFQNMSLSHFDHAFPAFDKEVSTVARTRVDWVETPEAHVFKADLPGMKKEEIKVQIADDGVLSISGERNKEEVNERNSYRKVERSYGKFYRQFKLPKNSKPQDITAKIENGVLTVTVPKTKESKEEAEVRNVEISS